MALPAALVRRVTRRGRSEWCYLLVVNLEPYIQNETNAGETWTRTEQFTSLIARHVSPQYNAGITYINAETIDLSDSDKSKHHVPPILLYLPRLPTQHRVTGH